MLATSPGVIGPTRIHESGSGGGGRPSTLRSFGTVRCLTMEHTPGDEGDPDRGRQDPIGEVLAELTSIVDWARANRSRIGYFAAMYRTVTLRVNAAIDAGEFDDAERMRRLVEVFARRYLTAFEQFHAGRRCGAGWEVSFTATRRWRPIVIQQLLTGMNAHINLDLGIAAASVAAGAELEALHRDFVTINDILGGMIDGFVQQVQGVSPWIGVLDRIGGRTDRVLIRFSIERARDEAWSLATRLASTDRTRWDPTVAARDDWTAGFGRFLLAPGRMLGLGLLLVRVRETNRVVRVIDALSGEAAGAT